MNFATKYRPKDFAEVVGQEHVKKTLLSSLRKNSASHAFLFCGGRGTGKTTIARILAKALNCLNPKNGEPCNECEMCKSATNASLVDLIEIDAASHTGVDNVRDLIEKMQFQPTVANKKIHIIDEVHMLSRGAFNALLKTLEEPPEHIYFILATTERHKIPETIQSRCQSFNFRQLTNDEIAGRLQDICNHENIKADRDGLLMLANEANGGLRDAIFLLEQHSGEGEIDSKILASQLGLAPHTALEKLYGFIQEGNMQEAIDLTTDIANEGFSISSFSKGFLAFLRDKMLYMVENDKKEDLAEVLEFLRIFSRAHVDLKHSIIPTLPLEMAIISSIQGENSSKKGEKKGGWFNFSKKEEERKSAPVAEIPRLKKEEIPKELEEKKEVVFMSKELSEENIRASWQQIVEKIKTPMLKANFRLSVHPGRFTNNTLELIVNSNMLKDKIENPAFQPEIIKAFEEIFDRSIKLEVIIEKIKLEPIEKKEEANLSGKDLEDAAKEIFS